MKKLFLLLPGLFTAAIVQAQSGPVSDRWTETRGFTSGQRPQSVIIERTEKPNEIKRKRTTYSGIAVQLFKTDNPLQLVNPAAPARYGYAQDNTARDLTTGKMTGLKLFSIEF